MWIFILILILIALIVGFIALIVKLIKWLAMPTYWHKTSFGWYGTGNRQLTEKDKKHIRKMENRKS